ncbi:MAG: hypothetical protein HQL46_16010 [Gammaproteobacteria bacterium]|nr:hypothetical protein [Gammaproteobacteria bacterium]
MKKTITTIFVAAVSLSATSAFAFGFNSDNGPSWNNSRSFDMPWNGSNGWSRGWSSNGYNRPWNRGWRNNGYNRGFNNGPWEDMPWDNGNMPWTGGNMPWNGGRGPMNFDSNRPFNWNNNRPYNPNYQGQGPMPPAPMNAMPTEPYPGDAPQQVPAN